MGMLTLFLSMHVRLETTRRTRGLHCPLVHLRAPKTKPFYFFPVRPHRPTVPPSKIQVNDMNAPALALYFASASALFEPNSDQAERLTSELIELSTRYNFAFWLAGVVRGWVRSVSGNVLEEGLSWLEQGIEDYRAARCTARAFQSGWR